MDNFRSLLEDLGKVLKGRGAVIACALASGVAFVAIIIGISSVSGSRGIATPAVTTGAPVTQEEATVAPATEGDAGEAADDVPLPATDPAPAPSEEQRSAIASYGDRERTLVSKLKGTQWLSPERQLVTFTDDLISFEGERAKAYAITAVSDTTSRAGSQDGSPQVKATDFTILDANGASHLCSLETDDGAGSSWLIGDLFGGSDDSELQSFQPGTGFAFQPPQELVGSTGADPAQLSSAISGWARQYAPTASTATWDKKVEVARARGTVSFSLTMDDYVRTKANVTYHTDSRSIDIQKDEGKQEATIG